MAAAAVLIAGVATAGPSGQQPSLSELVEEFRAAAIFWQQAEIGEKIVALGRTGGLGRLEPWLAHEDRHIRGNVAFVFAALGGMTVIGMVAALAGVGAVLTARWCLVDRQA